ncbi:hypothetical protein ACQ4M3_37970 [Leptolyngbya sp. AN03gr2]
MSCNCIQFSPEVRVNQLSREPDLNAKRFVFLQMMALTSSVNPDLRKGLR